MRFFQIMIVFGLLAVLSTPAISKVYECEFKGQGMGGFIPEVVVIYHDQDSGIIQVIDPFIKHYKESPIPATLGIVNEKRTSYSWNLQGITLEGGGVRQYVSNTRFRVVIRNATHKATISADPLGYVDTFRGNGSCKLRK